MSAAADALMGIFGFKRVEGDEMSKSVEEVRRELFERIYPRGERALGDDGLYSGPLASFYNARWESFCVALDHSHEVPVSVTMDEFKAICRAYGNAVPASVIPGDMITVRSGLTYKAASDADCRAAIEQTGLGIRVK